MLSLVNRDKRLAPFEWSVSDKLAGAGYGVQPGSALVPWGADELATVPGHEAQIESLRREVKDAFPTLALDVDEVQFYQRRYAKAMDPRSEIAGCSLIAPPTQEP
jgi:hypothetical protein